jgi:hypothetical protein
MKTLYVLLVCAIVLTGVSIIVFLFLGWYLS